MRQRIANMDLRKTLTDDSSKSLVKLSFSVNKLQKITEIINWNEIECYWKPHWQYNLRIFTHFFCSGVFSFLHLKVCFRRRTRLYF